MHIYRQIGLPGWAFGALAALAAALFAPDAAQANTCGALNAGNSFTENCPDATYANGIAYPGQTNSVTLTVPGVTASGGTTITTRNTDPDAGIFVRAADHATAAHNIALTVGSAGATVNIVANSAPRANTHHRNHGISIFTRGANGATVTMDVRSGVAIGSATTPMGNRGIFVETQAPGISGAAGAGDISVTSAATVHSTAEGIFVRNIGPGAVMVTNSGAIATAQRGIYVDDQGSAGAVTVTSSGAITSTSTGNGADGIFATTTRKDAAGANAGVSITHSAEAIAVTTGGVGIRAHVGAAREESRAGHPNYVAPLNAGLAKVDVRGGSVSSKNNAIEAINYEAGSVQVDTSEGVTLTSSDGHGIDAALTDVGNTSGTITVTSAATIKAGTNDELTAMQLRHGIRVDRAAGAGAVTVTNSGAIEANGYGIFAVAKGGGGAVAVTNSGDLGTAAARVDRGIFASHEGVGAAGDVTVTSSGAITADGDGIFARTIGKDAAGAKAGVTVTHSAGAIASADGRGIKAHVGAPRQERDTTHDDYVAPRNAGLAKVEVTGGSISSKWEPIEAFNYEAGSIEVRVSSGVALTSTHGFGIWGSLTDAGAAGGIVVVNAGTIRVAKSGIAFNIEAGSGNIEVTNSGAIEAGAAGIWATARRAATGDITVTNSGAIGKADARAVYGVFASHDGGGATGAVAVTNSGAIWASDRGILAQTKTLDVDGAKDGTTVTHSAGAINVTDAGLVDGDMTGIVARVGNWRHERDPGHDDYVAPKNTGAVKIDVTGGSIVAKGSAVEGANYEAGGVEIDIAKGVTLRSTHEHAIEADLRDVGNAGGTIAITQAGTIGASADGVSAKVTRMDPVTAPDRPVIDIVWTGTFASVEGGGGGIPSVARAVTAVQGRQAIEAAGIRYVHASGSAGIDAGVMKWEAFMRPVSEGDDPGEFSDAAAVTALFADGADAATKARAAAIVTQFRAVLTDESLGTIPGADAIDDNDDDAYSDAEIVAYLSEDDADRRMLLRNILTQSFTEHEAAVFRAVLTDGDVEAALAAAPAGYGDAWKAGVRALLARHNDGNIRIAMNGGSIVSSGDGIRAFFGRTHDDNGAIRISVAEGASVTGGVAGVYVENAGHGLRIEKKYTSPAVQALNEDLGPDDIVTIAEHHDQIVRVNGTVTGGTDAAVHLAGGGALVLGKTGKLVAGSSGRAVLVNHPGLAVVWIDGEAAGGEGAPAAVHLTGGGSVTVGLDGRIRANGAAAAIRGDNEPTVVIVQTGETLGELTQESAAEALARIEGGIVGDGIVGDGAGGNVILAEIEDGVATGHTRELPLDEEGEPVLDELPKEAGEAPAPMPTEFSCAMAVDGRCRLYEALPSVLLAMNALPTRDERLAAARDGRGSWARVETARGKWEADSSTQAGVAYDHRRHGVRVGLDFPVGENSGVGASVHGFRGSATTRAMAGVTHEIEASGIGLGAHATTMVDDIYVDAQAAVTWFDAELSSSTHGALEDEAEGLGLALGLEAGRRVALGDGLSVTPRAGLGWSQATLDDFTDEVGSSARVSLKDAQSVTGRAGLGVEASGGEGVLLSGSVDAMHDFTAETRVDAAGSALEASGPATSVRFGVDGALALADGAQLRAAASYTASGGDTHVWGGALNVIVRF